MRNILKYLGIKLLSEGERVATRALLNEFQISRYHRRGIRRVRRAAISRPERLNLGSGSVCKNGYLNIDLFPGGDLTLDLRRGLPFESNCCESIFSEHFFEHVDYPEPIGFLFRECLRVLRPGGFLRFSVPDTEWPLVDYAHGPQAPYFKACAENSWWHPECTTRMEHINYHFRQLGQHRFAYDEETARKLLESFGFIEVGKRAFVDGLDSEHRKLGSLFISARKPNGAL